MTTEQNKKEGELNTDAKVEQDKKDLKTEHPISERDEVKKAEYRTQDLQNGTSKPDDKEVD